MKTVLFRTFKTRNIISFNEKNYKKVMKLNLDCNISFNKDEKIKHISIDEDYVVVKEVKYDLNENIREIIIETKIIEAQTEQEFLSELQPYKEKDWYE